MRFHWSQRDFEKMFCESHEWQIGPKFCRDAEGNNACYLTLQILEYLYPQNWHLFDHFVCIMANGTIVY